MFLFQLIGCVCGCIGVILVALGTATCHWLEAKGFHQGVWQYCVEKGDYEQCEFDTEKSIFCNSIAIK